MITPFEKKLKINEIETMSIFLLRTSYNLPCLEILIANERRVIINVSIEI